MTKTPAQLNHDIAEMLVKALHKRALTIAEKRYERSTKRARQHFGPTEQQDCANAILLAKHAYSVAIEKADLSLHTRLAGITADADGWRITAAPEEK